jgi:hypothetical protein
MPWYANKNQDLQYWEFSIVESKTFHFHIPSLSKHQKTYYYEKKCTNNPSTPPRKWKFGMAHQKEGRKTLNTTPSPNQNKE